MIFELAMFFMVAFFIILFNWLGVKVYDKLNTERRLYDAYVSSGRPKIILINNYWMTLSYQFTGLNLYYFVNEKGEMINKDGDINNDSKMVECGLKGEYMNPSSPCTIFYQSLLGLLT